MNNKNCTICIILGIAVLFFAFYYFLPKEKQEIIDKTSENIYEPSIPTAFASRFATYEEISVNVSPRVPEYSINKNLSNITNANDLKFLSEEAKRMLEKNAFVVIPGHDNEFFSLYESNRYMQIPNFITTDSILHNYHLMFDHLLKQLEEQKLIKELKNLNHNMLSQSLSQYNSLIGTEWENAAKTNIGFFAVGSKLLDSSIDIPLIVKNKVNQELALIEAHQGLGDSPVMGLREDYSQYIPRGHYDKTEELKAYFKSMMWYGRLTFKIKEEDKIRSAMLITLALDSDINKEIFNKIYEPINFFVGKSDDISYYEFKNLIDQIYEDTTLQSLIVNENAFDSFVDATRTLEAPQINSMPIFNAEIDTDREAETKGFRFMGQRFTIDAAIFQRLIVREVGPKGEPCTGPIFSEGRMLPKALDIPSAMGSAEALNILNNQGETQYACYSDNMSKIQSHISNLPIENWTQNLYWGWLYQLSPLLDVKKEGYPIFMQNLAWMRKDINTFLGSFTELKHDTILYAKQVYAEMGGGGFEENKDDRGYVEPNPYVYARLASLLKMTNEGLETRGLLTPSMKDNLSKMEKLVISLKAISEKELNDEKLTDAEYELIRSYGGQLEHFWYEVNKEDMGSVNPMSYLDDNPAAIIADIATDPNGEVLEEGTGKIFSIYVAVPIDGKLRIAKGGVYSYYEFEWPMSDRLTDKKWREMLNSGKAPQLPEWTDAFIAK